MRACHAGDHDPLSRELSPIQSSRRSKRRALGPALALWSIAAPSLAQPAPAPVVPASAADAGVVADAAPPIQLAPAVPDGAALPAPSAGEAPVLSEPQPSEPVPADPAVEAHAEASAEAASEPVPEGDVMLVTAQFRKQNPQKTPVTMSVIGGEKLTERGQVTIADLAQAPNVKLSPGSGSFGPSLQAFIRGVGQNDFNFALEPGVGVYVDDVYYATLTGSIIDLLDLERVEILRGPQGTLTGQNSIGGAIRMYSKRPQGGNNGFVNVIYGRYNRTEVRAAGDFTIVDRKLFARISGVGNRSDGYVTRYDYACAHPGSGVPSYQNSAKCKLGSEGGRSYAGVRTSLRWLLSDRVEVNLSGDFTKDNSEATPQTLLYVGNMMGPGLPAMPPSGPNTQVAGIPLGTADGSQFVSYSPFGNYALDPYTHSAYANYSTYSDPNPVDGSAPYSIPPVYRVDSGGASLKLDVDLTDRIVLIAIGAYRQYKGDWSADEGSPVGTYLLHNVVANRQGTAELRVTGKLFKDYIDFTVGGFYLNRESYYGGRISLRTAQFLEDDKIPATTGAVFTNVEGHVTDKLDLIAGVRYTNQTKEFHYGRGFVQGAMINPGIDALDGTVGKFSGDRFDYRGAVQYQLLSSLMGYASVASGFKSGGVNPRPFVADQALPHKPETLIAYELGAKSDWFERKLRANVAGFFNQYNDILMQVSMCPQSSVPAPCFLPINAGKANVAGFEVEAVGRPIRGLELEASMAYLNFKYRSISSSASTSGITKDMTAPFAPQWQASAGARYAIQLGPYGSLTPRLDLIYQDSFYTLPTNTRFSEVDSRVILNGRLSWLSSDDLWETALEVTNITNKLYYYNVRDDRASTYTVTGQPAPPIRWALSLRRNFL